MYFAGTNGWIRNWFIFTLQTLKLIYSLSSNSFRCFEGVWNLAESVFCEIIWYFLDYFEIYFWYVVPYIALRHLSKLRCNYNIWVTQTELCHAQQMFMGILKWIHWLHRLFYKITNSQTNVEIRNILNWKDVNTFFEYLEIMSDRIIFNWKPKVLVNT